MPSFRARVFAATALTLLTTALAVPTPSHAQDDMRARGEKACGGDAVRVCKKFLKGGDFAVLSCFQENKLKLTSHCRKFLTDAGQLN